MQCTPLCICVVMRFVSFDAHFLCVIFYFAKMTHDGDDGDDDDDNDDDIDNAEKKNAEKKNAMNSGE